VSCAHWRGGGNTTNALWFNFLFDGEKFHIRTGTDTQPRTTVVNRCLEASTSPITTVAADAADNDDAFTPTLLLRQIGLIVLAVAVLVGVAVAVYKLIVQCTAAGQPPSLISIGPVSK